MLLVDHIAGEDDLVAKLESDLAPFATDVDRARAGTGTEVEIAGREARQADRRKKRPHRQIFAVGDEVGLVVAADHLSARRDDKDAVGGAVDMHAVLRRDRDPAGEQAIVGAEQRGGSSALELGEGLVLVGAGVVERISHRGLGPEQKPRLGGRRSRQHGEAPGGFQVEARPPFVLLADVRLDNADVKDGKRVLRNRRGRHDAEQDGCADDHHQRQPLAVVFEPDRPAEHHDKPGEAIGADQRRGPDQRSRGESSRCRIPREAREHRSAQPFGDGPGATEHDH